jgi:plastocyanin
MLTPTSKVFLPVAGVALFLGALYKIFSADVFGSALFLVVGVVAFVLGVTLSSIRENEYAPPLPSNAPPPSVRAVAVAPRPGGGGWGIAAAAAAVLVMLGLVENWVFTYAGLLVALAAGAGWLARSTSESTGRHISLMPIGMPVLGLATIASVMFFISRILLAVPEEASTAIALFVAVLILGGASIAALRPNISGRTLAAVLVVGSLIMVAGGITAAARGERDIEHPGEEAAGEAGVVQLKAEGVTFKTDTINLPAGQDVEIRFDNNDRDVQHNLDIFGADPSKPIFRGDLVTGVATVTYKIHAPGPGEYKFQCDVHPTQMKGTVKVT